MAKAVSKMGTPRIRRGRARATVATSLSTPVIEMAARVKPRKRLPESPMKILAGLKL
ncbi:hypothetical protein D3C87_1478790 [compost metagenome]